jgi:hypothetical protein
VSQRPACCDGFRGHLTEPTVCQTLQRAAACQQIRHQTKKQSCRSSSVFYILRMRRRFTKTAGRHEAQLFDFQIFLGNLQRSVAQVSLAENVRVLIDQSVVFLFKAGLHVAVIIAVPCGAGSVLGVV